MGKMITQQLTRLEDTTASYAIVLRSAMLLEQMIIKIIHAGEGLVVASSA